MKIITKTQRERERDVYPVVICYVCVMMIWPWLWRDPKKRRRRRTWRWDRHRRSKGRIQPRRRSGCNEGMGKRRCGRSGIQGLHGASDRYRMPWPDPPLRCGGPTVWQPLIPTMARSCRRGPRVALRWRFGKIVCHCSELSWFLMNPFRVSLLDQTRYLFLGKERFRQQYITKNKNQDKLICWIHHATLSLLWGDDRIRHFSLV